MSRARRSCRKSTSLGRIAARYPSCLAGMPSILNSAAGLSRRSLCNAARHLAPVMAALLLLALAGAADSVYLGLSPLWPVEGQSLSASLVTFRFQVEHNTSVALCNLSLDDQPLSGALAINSSETVNYTAYVPPGQHSWQARCAAAPVENSTGHVNFTMLDVLPPSVSAVAPANGTVFAQGLVSFLVNASDDAALANCTLFSDDVPVTSVLTPGVGVIALNASLDEGWHSWRVGCADTGGNANTTSLRSLGIDLTAPFVAFSEPVPWLNTTVESVTFNISAIDASGMQCALSMDGSQAFAFSLPLSGWYRTPALVSAGNHTFQANCTDQAGRSSLSPQGKITRLAMTQDDLLLQLGTDKPAYQPGEPLDILVNATSGGKVNLLITRDGQLYYNYTYTAGPSVSPPGVFLSTSGTYTLSGTLTFLELQRNSAAVFTVGSALACSINGSQQPRLGVSEPYSGSAINAAGGVSYSWDFNGDTITDALGQSASYAFLSAGVPVTLRVQDTSGQATCQLQVQPQAWHALQFIVFDNATSLLLPGALAETGNHSALADTAGIAAILLPGGQHFVLVSKDGYDPYFGTIELSGNLSLTIRLSPKILDGQPPVVTAISPVHGGILGGDLSLTFGVQDASTVRCTLFFSPYAGWWAAERDDIVLPPAEGTARFTHVLSSQNLTQGTYYWKVACEDSAGHAAESGDLSFTYASGGITEVGASLRGTERILVAMERIEAAIEGARRLSPDEGEVASILGVAAGLDSQKTELIRIRNEYRNTLDPLVIVESEADLQRFDSQFAPSIEAIEKETLVSASILQRDEFVKYELSESVRETLQSYLAFRGSGEGDIVRITEALGELQSDVTITTTAYRVETAFLSGELRNITLLRRRLSFGNASTLSRASIFLEHIPKSLAASASELAFVGNYQVLEDDPLIRLYPTEDGELIYYFKKEVPLERVRDISAVVLEDALLDAASGSSRLPTGFAIASLVPGGGGLAFLAVLVIVGGASVFVVASGFSPGRRASSSRPRILPQALTEALQRRGVTKKVLSQVDELLGEAEHAVRARNHQRAKELYRELSALYPSVPAVHQDELRGVMTDICSGINGAWAEGLISEAYRGLALGDAAKAREAYRQVSRVYVALGGETKAKMHAQSKELFDRLLTLDAEQAIRSIREAVQRGDRAAAARSYRKLQALYRKLPPRQRLAMAGRVAPFLDVLRKL